MMDPASQPKEAPARARALTPAEPPRAAGAEPIRHRAFYTAKPDFGPPPTITDKPAPGRRGLWLLALAAAAVLLGGGIVLRNHLVPVPGVPSDYRLVLTSADIDQAATVSARALLARGGIPAALASAGSETRREVADGRQALYSKQLLPPESPAGFVVHVTISAAGTVVGEDVLSSERPHGTTFPAGPGTPLHFHFVVERAGPAGTITCGVKSTGGVSVYTAAMSTGGSGDLEVVAQ